MCTAGDLFDIFRSQILQSNIYPIYISVEINNRNRLMTSMLEFLKIK